MTSASITSDPHLAPIPAADRGSVVGAVALVELVPGTLVTRSELGISDGFTAGQVLVGLALKQGQLPARGVAAGDTVLVVATPGTGSGPAADVPTGTGSGVRAVVADVGPLDASSGATVVDVRVPVAVGVAVTQLAAAGDAAVILLPVGG